jgi:hypothetical protein
MALYGNSSASFMNIKPYDPMQQVQEEDSKNGWGVVRIGEVDYQVADLLQGTEGIMKPAKVRPLLTLLREFKKINQETMESKLHMREPLQAFEMHKDNILHMQEFLNSFEAAIELLATPEVLQALEGIKPPPTIYIKT